MVRTQSRDGIYADREGERRGGRPDVFSPPPPPPKSELVGMNEFRGWVGSLAPGRISAPLAEELRPPSAGAAAAHSAAHAPAPAAAISKDNQTKFVRDRAVFAWRERRPAGTSYKSTCSRGDRIAGTVWVARPCVLRRSIVVLRLDGEMILTGKQRAPVMFRWRRERVQETLTRWAERKRLPWFCDGFVSRVTVDAAFAQGQK